VQAPGTSFSSPLVAGAAAWVWTTRPELDNTQLFELIRRSAVDIGPPGFDTASGYGILSIPSALSFPAPSRDPQEPNEDPAQIEPHGLFPTGTQPLNGPGRLERVLSAHLDRSEDPVDLYRAWAPAHQVLHVRTAGPVRTRVLRRIGQSSKTATLVVGNRGTAAYRNASARGAYVYVELTPALRVADYTLRLTVARQ